MAGLKSKRVGVYIPSCDEIAAGTCLGVNDKGLTLDIEMSADDAEGSKLIPGVAFLPWSSIGYVHIPDSNNAVEF